MNEDFSFESMEDGFEFETGTCDDCSVCGATVHLTHVENNETQTYHLCENCARKRGIPIPDGASLLKGLEAMVGNGAADVGHTHVKVTVKPMPGGLQGLSGGTPAAAVGLPPQIVAAAQDESAIKCGGCAMPLSEFRATGRLGCAKCYDKFWNVLEKMIEHMHGSKLHRGKIYASAAPRITKQELERLRGELDAAIKAEQFEEAALIRDTIRGARVKR